MPSKTTKFTKVKEFSKDQILKSKQFSFVQKDLLKTLLDDSKTYSLEEAEKILEKEFKRKVK